MVSAATQTSRICAQVVCSGPCLDRESHPFERPSRPPPPARRSAAWRASRSDLTARRCRADRRSPAHDDGRRAAHGIRHSGLWLVLIIRRLPVLAPQTAPVLAQNGWMDQPAPRHCLHRWGNCAGYRLLPGGDGELIDPAVGDTAVPFPAAVARQSASSGAGVLRGTDLTSESSAVVRLAATRLNGRPWAANAWAAKFRRRRPARRTGVAAGAEEPGSAPCFATSRSSRLSAGSASLPRNKEPDVPDPLVRAVGIDLVSDERAALVEPAERLAHFLRAAGDVDILQPETPAAAGKVPGPRARRCPTAVLIGRNHHPRYPWPSAARID